MTDYRPVACQIYGGLELAILHCRRLRIVWRDSMGRRHMAVFRPRDLVTRNHEEHLIAETGDGGRHEIRLDRILGWGSFDPKWD